MSQSTRGAAAPETNPPDHGKTILFADGDAETSKCAAHVLARAGYEVRTCRDARDARELASRHPPALAFIAHALPDAPGLELAHHFRNNPKLANTFLVLLTDANDPATDPADTAPAPDAALVDTRLVRPVVAADLPARVETYLAMRTAQQTLRQNEQQWWRTFDAVADAVALLDTEQRIVRCNRAMGHLMGLSPGELVGRHCWEAFHGEKCPLPGCPFQTALATGRRERTELRIGDRWFEVAVDPILNERHVPTGAVHIVRDITDSRKLLDTLRDSERRVRLLFENALNGVALHKIVLDDRGGPVDYIYVLVNPAFETHTGLRASEVLGRRVTELFPGLPQAPFIERYGPVALTGESIRFEHHFAPLRRTFQIGAFQVGPGHFATVFQDVTEHRRHEAEVENLNSFLLSIRDLNQAIVRETDFDTLLDESCAILMRIAGYQDVAIAFRNESTGRLEPRAHAGTHVRGNWTHPPREGEESPPCIQRVAETGASLVLDPDEAPCSTCPACSHDRGRRSIVCPMKASDGTILGMIQTCMEPGRLIHPQEPPLFEEVAGDLVYAYEKLRTEAALREHERMVSTLMGNLPGVAYRCRNDPDWTMLYLSEGCQPLTGYSPGELTESSGFQYADLIHPDDRERVWATIQKALREHRTFQLEYRIRTKEGGEKWVWERGVGIASPEGAFAILEGFITDITDRKNTELALRENENRLRSVFRVAPVGIGVVRDRILLEVNSRVSEMTGYAPEELTGVSARILYPTEADYEYVGKEKYRQIAETGSGSVETRWQRKDGSLLDVLLSSTPMVPEDLSKGLTFTALDITARKRAESEREKLQQQLLQSQKLESVGRLAGGIAHDFNNMLGVILGNAEITMERLPPENPLRVELDEIRKAAQRSAELTQQLLAFARKQTVSPRPLDLDHILGHMLKMLRRLIGEDIRLAREPSRAAWKVVIDPAQLEQVVANLVVNARDAIENAGTITLAASDATLDTAECAKFPGLLPGDYVRLTVADDGHGMHPETLASIFDPFFTTKPLGKGTGLGLSTVYGIVKQNGGSVHAFSEPGRGSTFFVHLPRCDADPAMPPALPQETPIETTPTGVRKTILVVEDETSVLRLATLQLQELGYRVLAAQSPREALRLAKDHSGPLHLLVTDVIMPEMNGRDLANRLLVHFPALECVFMSGYPADAIAHHGILDPGVRFLQKPFSMKQLATEVRNALVPAADPGPLPPPEPPTDPREAP